MYRLEDKILNTIIHIGLFIDKENIKRDYKRVFKLSEDFDSVYCFDFISDDRKKCNLINRLFFVKIINPNDEVIKIECENVFETAGMFSFELKSELKKVVGIHKILMFEKKETEDILMYEGEYEITNVES